ncbi:hypothetical protein AACT_2774 [Arcobacter acticola]|uniref:Uncharacterized protein n=1 Tax=Arcobacter acticola TaxID=1849015 RepID=A0A6M8ERF4_9BACT|nr:hypothetical protein [Arcobacter acticola]QKE29841.1 hypothetical protein AACT_2774 [Arcobacter acticola]
MNNCEQPSHLVSILSDLIEGKILISTDIRASNANQYFCIIKKWGINLIEVKKQNLTNRAYHLERKLDLAFDNLEKAKVHLKRLQNNK